MKTILILTSLLLATCAYAQTNSSDLLGSEKKVIWDYPVKPGMKEWSHFESNEEMVRACQIPERVLPLLSTAELTDLCLQYPLLYDVFAFNNLNKGMDKLFDDFNGMRELFRRKDVSDELLKHYKLKMRNLSFLKERYSDVEKGMYIISISALEVLLVRCEDSLESYKEILQHLVSGYENKFAYAEYFKGLGFRTNIYSRAHVIIKTSNKSISELSERNINAALLSGMADAETIHALDELSYQLIK